MLFAAHKIFKSNIKQSPQLIIFLVLVISFSIYSFFNIDNSFKYLPHSQVFATSPPPSASPVAQTFDLNSENNFEVTFTTQDNIIEYVSEDKYFYAAGFWIEADIGECELVTTSTGIDGANDTLESYVDQFNLEHKLAESPYIEGNGPDYSFWLNFTEPGYTYFRIYGYAPQDDDYDVNVQLSGDCTSVSSSGKNPEDPIVLNQDNSFRFTVDTEQDYEDYQGVPTYLTLFVRAELPVATCEVKSDAPHPIQILLQDFNDDEYYEDPYSNVNIYKDLSDQYVGYPFTQSYPGNRYFVLFDNANRTDDASQFDVWIECEGNSIPGRYPGDPLVIDLESASTFEIDPANYQRDDDGFVYLRLDNSNNICSISNDPRINNLGVNLIDYKSNSNYDGYDIFDHDYNYDKTYYFDSSSGSRYIKLELFDDRAFSLRAECGNIYPGTLRLNPIELLPYNEFSYQIDSATFPVGDNGNYYIYFKMPAGNGNSTVTFNPSFSGEYDLQLDYYDDKSFENSISTDDYYFEYVEDTLVINEIPIPDLGWYYFVISTSSSDYEQEQLTGFSLSSTVSNLPEAGSHLIHPYMLDITNSFEAELDGTSYPLDTEATNGEGYFGYFRANLGEGQCQATFDTDNWTYAHVGTEGDNIISNYYHLYVFSDPEYDNQTAFDSVIPYSYVSNPAQFDFELNEPGDYFFKVGGYRNINNYSITFSGECVDNLPESNIRFAKGLPADYSGDTTTANASIDSIGEDTLLVVNVAFRSNTGAEVTNIVAGGQQLTKGCRAHAHEYPNETWYLANPPASASLPITVNFSNTTSDGVITPVIFTGVDQTNPVSTSSCWDTDDEGGWGFTPNVSIDAVAGQVVVGGFTAYSAGGQTITSDPTQTEIWNIGQASNTATGGSYYDVISPDTINLNWTVNKDTPWSASAIAINSTTTEPPSPPPGDGTEPGKAISITQDDSTYSFTDNTDGSYTYAELDLSSASTSARLFVETYDVGSGNNVDTLIEFFGEDSTFTEKEVENDDFYGQYSRYYFNASSGSKYYFRISDKLGSGGDFGLRYVIPSASDHVGPEVVLSNFSIDPTQENQPTWTGVATDTQNPISSVAISITNSFNETELIWTEVTPSDGAWDEFEEEFSFTSPIELTDGVKNILVRAIDTNDAVTDRGDFNGFTNYFYAADRIIVEAVDTAVPIIQIYDIVPNPIADSQPKIQGKVEDNDNNQRLLTSYIDQIYYSLDAGAWQAVESLDGTYDSDIEAFSIQMPELSVGEHTVTIRAVDQAGNDTDAVNPKQNQSVTFTVEEPDPNLTATILEKNETFIDQEDLDFIAGENYIWGNGMLRMSETFNPEIQPLVTGPEFGHRYVDDLSINPNVAPSSTGGTWLAKGYGKFSYYDPTSQQELEFDIREHGVPSHVLDLQEIRTDSGDYHLWINAYHYVILVDFGSSITDGQDDLWMSKYFSYPTGVMAIDNREGQYGVYVSTGGGLYYYKINELGSSADDELFRFEPTPGDNELWLDNITSMYFDQNKNQLWIGEYSEGLRVLDDHGTPTDLEDSNFYDFVGYEGIFDIGMDKDDLIYFAGNQGLFQFTDWGEVEWGDETITNLLTNEATGENPISQVVYQSGEYPVGSQYFIGTRTGDIFYLSTNDTPSNLVDDQITSFSVTEGRYPAETFGMYSLDYDNLIVAIRRMGIYQVNLNRDFALSGYAESQTDARIEGRLDVDFITLDNVNVIVEAGGVSYQVSNDGGESWHNISPGETINFPEHDYRIKFRINMTHGSTPVIGGYDLSYASYPTPEERGSYIRVADEPDRVTPGESLTFKVESFDDLNNPVEGNVSAQLELRKANNNEAVDFEVDDVTIVDGSVTIITTAPLEVGDYRIYVWNEDSSDYSDVITVDYPPVDPPDDHDENGDQDDDGDADDGQTDGDSDDDDDDDDKSTQKKYNPSISLKSSVDGLSEPESVLISWESKYVDVVELKSQYMNYGVVELDGARNIYVDKDTTFWVTGGGPRGSVKAEVRIAWLGDTSPSTGDPGSGGDSQTDQPPVISSEDIISTEPPTIENFTVTPDPDEPTKIVVEWRVDDADFVEISPIGGPLAAEGSKEIFITEPKTTFVLTARNEAGEVKEERLIEIDQSDLDERLAFLKNVEANLANEKNQFGSWWKGDFTKAISALLILLLVSFWLAWLVRRRKSKKEQVAKFPQNPTRFD